VHALYRHRLILIILNQSYQKFPITKRISIKKIYTLTFYEGRERMGTNKDQI
jgi:hypothetical protein